MGKEALERPLRGAVEVGSIIDDEIERFGKLRANDFLKTPPIALVDFEIELRSAPVIIFAEPQVQMGQSNGRKTRLLAG